MPADHGWIIARRAKNGEYYFVVEAENDEVIAVSEMYTTKAGAENGITALKRVLRGEPVYLDWTDKPPVK